MNTTARLLIVAAVSAPISIGTGYIIAALFPMMAGVTAGLVGGALTLPTILLVMAAGRDW